MARPIRSSTSRGGQSGVVLIEVLVSVLIFSIGILSIVGLQAFAVERVSDAKYRLDASMVANQRLGRMWVDPGNLGNYVVADETVTELPNGRLTITLGAANEVAVTVTWQAPHAANTSSYTQIARINTAGT